MGEFVRVFLQLVVRGLSSAIPGTICPPMLALPTPSPLPPIPSALHALGLVELTRPFALRRSCTLALLAKVSTGLPSDATLADVARRARDHGALVDLLEASHLDGSARVLCKLAELEDADVRIDFDLLEDARAHHKRAAAPMEPHAWNDSCLGSALAAALRGTDLAALEALAIDSLKDDDELSMRAIAARVVAVAPSAAALHGVRQRVRNAWQAIADAAMPDAPGEVTWPDALFDDAGTTAAVAMWD